MTAPSRRMTAAALAAVIFGVAFAFRLILLADYEPVSPWVAAQTLADAEMGRNLLEGRGWVANRTLMARASEAQRRSGQRTMVDLNNLLPVDDGNAASLVTAGSAHSPGYSTWFALSYWLGGEYRYVYSQRMQAVVDSLAATLVFAIGALCWSTTAGAIGGLAYAVSPAHAFLANLTVAASTDSFWFLLSALGAMVAVSASMRGTSPLKGAMLVGAAGLGGACMNSTPLVLPAVTAMIAGTTSLWDRRLRKAAVFLVAAQVAVLIALTPWAFRNQRLFDQFALVRGTFWQLAFAAWGELPNPWGLGFDDKEYWHWIDENCPRCSAGAQQEAMRTFLVRDVLMSRPFPRHVGNLLALRAPRLVDVARTPDGVLAEDAPRWLRSWLVTWNHWPPWLAAIAAAGLLLAVRHPESRFQALVGLGPSLFLIVFSLLFYVELRKTVPAYGFLMAAVGVAVAAIVERALALFTKFPRPATVVCAIGVTALLTTATGEAQSPTVLAAGELYSEAVTADGEVWGWGNNLYGQIGSGNHAGRYAVETKAKAGELQNAVSVSNGSSHTIALMRDGSVWAWGDNSLGQLGSGSRQPASRPIRTLLARPAVAVAGGNVHSLALDNSGKVWAWGSNLYGQLGPVAATEVVQPVEVPLPRPVVAIAAGWFFSLAVDDTGAVWAWGQNRRGQLGSGRPADASRPVRVEALTRIHAIAAGHQHALALTDDGRVWAWGANDYGQVGTAPSGSDLSQPRAFDLLDSMASEPRTKAASPSAAGRTEVAPRRVQGIPPAVHVTAAADASFIVTQDGRVWAWGDNLYGQLGDGTFATRAEPKPVIGLPPVTTLSAGYAHALAGAPDASVWSWGFGHYGQLGDATTERRRPVPQKIQAFRLREPDLNLAPENAHVYTTAHVAWKEPGVDLSGSGIRISGPAQGAYTYAVLSTPEIVGPGAPFGTLFVQGAVRTGGITVGVQVDQRWIYQANVPPGPFTVLWDVPTLSNAVIVIAHYLPGDSLVSDVDIRSWGWMKTSLPTH